METLMCPNVGRGTRGRLGADPQESKVRKSFLVGHRDNYHSERGNQSIGR